jgi:hypothetical protein
MTFDIGPFHLYRVSKSGTLDISLKCLENWSCGWEYGWRDDARGSVDKPFIQIRIGKLMIVYLEFFQTSCEIWFMGFWAFPSWEKRKNG